VRLDRTSKIGPIESHPETPARRAELDAELGHSRRPRPSRLPLGLTPIASLRQMPDPAWLGLARTPVTGLMRPCSTIAHTDAARRPS